MKKGIHPDYNSQATITCSCGAKWVTGAIRDLEVETCSQCNPFYTGKQKAAASAGRVARFEALKEKTNKAQESRKEVKSKEEKIEAKKAKAETKTEVKKPAKKVATKKTTKKA